MHVDRRVRHADCWGRRPAVARNAKGILRIVAGICVHMAVNISLAPVSPICSAAPAYSWHLPRFDGHHRLLEACGIERLMLLSVTDTQSALPDFAGLLLN